MQLAILFDHIQKVEDELLKELEIQVQGIIGHNNFECWVDKGVLHLENWEFPIEDFTDELNDLSNRLGFILNIKFV